MFNYRTIAVVKREIKALMLNKTFIIMTVLMPLIFMSGFLVVGLTQAINKVKDARIVIVEEQPFINDVVREFMSEREEVVSGEIVAEYKTMNRTDFDVFIRENRANFMSDSITGVFYIPFESRESKRIEFYSANPNNIVLSRRVSGVVNSALVELHFKGRDVAREDVAFARQGTDLDSFKISEDKDAEEEGAGSVILAFVFTFLLYISMFINGMQLLRAVTQEKSSRIVEILLSSVNARELMTAKVAGTAVTGLVQMLIWFSPMIILSIFQFTILPDNVMEKVNFVTNSIEFGLVAYFVVNFLIGMVTFLALFSAVGAMFDNEQDAQQGMWPIVMLIMIPFFIAISIVTNPTSTLGVVSSMLPISSIMVMPARMALSNVPLWQVGVTLVVNLLVLGGILRVAGKIYRIGILRSGKKVTLPQVVKWMREDG